MRYLGLDLGSRRLGISISDKDGIIATSYKTIHHKEDYTYLLEELGKILEIEKIESIVLGFPKNMNNTIGPKGELSLMFKEQLENKFLLPVMLQDERLTTKEAEAVLINNNTSRKKRKEVIDSVAAVIILQSYLDKKGR